MNDHRAALRRFMERRELTVGGWTTAAEIPESTLRGYLSERNKSITMKTLEKLAQVQNVSVDEMLRGEERYAEAEANSMPVFDPGRAFKPPATADYRPVPVYDQRVSAGAGAVAIDASPIDFLMFREPWLHTISTNIGRLFVLEVTGDSDLPFLHSGDHALVDPGQRNPAREGRYVIRIDDELSVKIISLNPKTKLMTVKSGNPDYPTYADLPPDSIDIIGRVVWIARRIA